MLFNIFYNDTAMHNILNMIDMKLSSAIKCKRC